MTAQFKVALLRAVVTALATGGSTFFAMATSATLGVALYAAGAAAFTTLVARFGVEGWIDSRQPNP